MRSLSLLFFVAGMSMLLVGCTSTRSISGGSSSHRTSYHRDSNVFYRGELSQFSVLGASMENTVTEADIALAAESFEKPVLKKGDHVMLIQSGAIMPDDAMQTCMNQQLEVTPFSGVPESSDDKRDYHRTLRVVAARGGCEYILVYWGALESSYTDLATKTVSWVPIVGNVVPDEKQDMRIRLTLVVMDVSSGEWFMLMPEPISSKAISAGLNRGSSDDKLIAHLKNEGYRALCDQLWAGHLD